MVCIKDILNYLDENNVTYTYIGNIELIVDTYCPLNRLKDNCITWIRDIDSYNIYLLNAFKNLLVVCNYPKVISSLDGNYIITDNPHSIFFSILSKFFCNNQFDTIIEERNNSVIKTLEIGKNVTIGNFCYIGKDVSIEDNVIIKNNVSIDGKVKIGKNTVIYSGVIIGEDGFGYYDDINNCHLRAPHLGGVIVGENVEIGANTCIAKGCLGDTIINDNVKIDNLCHIAHNVIIGKNSKITAMSMLAGSSVIGEDVWVAPCSAIKNQVVVGNNSLIGIGAVVINNIDENTIVAGVPAKFLKSKI